EVVVLLNRYRDTDMVYSDEDKIYADGYLSTPYFKPDWSPEALLSRHYTGDFGVYRHSLLKEIGGFREGYEGSQDYDLVLRLTEKTGKIKHIAKILYHCRSGEPGATPDHPYSPAQASGAAKRVLEDALIRRQLQGTVVDAPGAAGHYVVRYEQAVEDLVSIIIPTKDLGATLDKCLASVFNKTSYKNYEIILVDNKTTEADAIAVMQKWERTFAGRLKRYVLDIPFNYSTLNNFAVTKAQGKYLVLLNNDIEVITSDWLEALMEYAQNDEIGVVGPKLLYPDDTIQHAGVIGGLGGIVAGHGHRLLPKDSPGYFNQLNTLNNYLALTGACLMCRAEVYREVGGLEERLAVAFNDVDFCFRLIQKGFR
ncbi:MAG: glycosyltransferase, partial [Cyanobacteria bacterium P01_F01_bin.4]